MIWIFWALWLLASASVTVLMYSLCVVASDADDRLEARRWEAEYGQPPVE